MSNQTKSEKQAIDAKIAKVREVVRGVSNNDIILALHNHDMDVGKTINAFTAGNMEAALGEWTQTNKAKKSKAKKNKAANADSSSSTTTETPVSVSRTPATTNPAPVQRPTQPTKHLVDSKSLSTPELDSLLHSLDIKSAHIHKSLDEAYSEQSAVVSAIRAVLNARERQLVSYLEQTRKQVDAKIHQQRANIQKFKQNKPSGEELARLKAETESLDALLQTNFKVHGEKAIKAIEKLGSGFAPSAEPVHYTPPPVVHHQVNGTAQQEKPAKNGQPVQQPAPPKPQQNGKAVNKNVNGTDIKHSISHSSLVSEENDSGYSHVSPNPPEKSIAQVSDGGFLFASDGLDADQLAKLQAQVAENLKAQGIDPTILASIASSDSTFSAPRRRQNQPPRAKENGKPTNKENKKPAGGKAVKT